MCIVCTKISSSTSALSTYYFEENCSWNTLCESWLRQCSMPKRLMHIFLGCSHLYQWNRHTLVPLHSRNIYFQDTDTLIEIMYLAKKDYTNSKSIYKLFLMLFGVDFETWRVNMLYVCQIASPRSPLVLVGGNRGSGQS